MTLFQGLLKMGIFGKCGFYALEASSRKKNTPINSNIGLIDVYNIY